jgi:hypothetical protein
MDDKVRNLLVLISVLAIITATYVLTVRHVSNQTTDPDIQELEQSPVVNDTRPEQVDSSPENYSDASARSSEDSLVSQSVNGLNQLYSDAVKSGKFIGPFFNSSENNLASQSVNGLNQLYSDAVNGSSLLLQSGKGS